MSDYDRWDDGPEVDWDSIPDPICHPSCGGCYACMGEDEDEAKRPSDSEESDSADDSANG